MCTIVRAVDWVSRLDIKVPSAAATCVRQTRRLELPCPWAQTYLRQELQLPEEQLELSVCADVPGRISFAQVAIVRQCALTVPECCCGVSTACRMLVSLPCSLSSVARSGHLRWV